MRNPSADVCLLAIFILTASLFQSVKAQKIAKGIYFVNTTSRIPIPDVSVQSDNSKYYSISDKMALLI
jgi:hypothetical protein